MGWNPLIWLYVVVLLNYETLSDDMVVVSGYQFTYIGRWWISIYNDTCYVATVRQADSSNYSSTVRSFLMTIIILPPRCHSI